MNLVGGSQPRIADVAAFLVTYVLPEPLRLPFHGGERTVLKRDAGYVRVRGGGLSGWAPLVADETVARLVREVVAPAAVGRSPREFLAAGPPAPGKAADVAYRAVEMAVSDLVARAEGVPLSELLGGRKRASVRLYGSAGMYTSPEGYAAEAAAVRDAGFTGYKMRPGGGPDADVAAVAAMRAATGPDFGLMVDAHTWWRMGDRSYSAALVTDLARALADHDIVWLEEPLPPADHDAYRELRAQRLVPVATGEHEPDIAGYRDLVGGDGTAPATDYVQSDLCSHGGYTGVGEVIDATARAGLRLAFHSWGTTLEVLAAAQLGACWPETVVPWLELPFHATPERPGLYPFPLADEILTEPLDVSGGALRLPPGPGLGIDVDDRVVERYPYRPGPWSLFRLDTPPQTVAVVGDHSVTWADA